MEFHIRFNRWDLCGCDQGETFTWYLVTVDEISQIRREPSERCDVGSLSTSGPATAAPCEKNQEDLDLTSAGKLPSTKYTFR